MELDGLTIVFAPVFHRSKHWIKRGVPNIYIHHSNFLEVMSNIIKRQEIILSDNPVNLILDYTKDRLIDPDPLTFWEEQIRLVTDKDAYEQARIVFYLDPNDIIRVNEPEEVYKFSRRVEKK